MLHQSYIPARLTCYLALAMASLAFFAEANAQMRTWTSKSGGHTIKAALLEFDGKVAKLQKANGKTVSVQKVDLAQSDRSYLEGLVSHPETLPDNKTEAWKTIMRAASQGYILGSNSIVPAKDGDQLLEIAQNGDEDLVVLSRQIVLRHVMNDKLDKSQSIFGEKFETAVRVAPDSTIVSAARQASENLLGNEVNYFSEMEAIMRDLGPVVQSGIDQQVESLGLVACYTLILG